ncbi:MULTISPECIES: hydroxymethylglutaryl-CoA reductase, degradative [Galbibacter]|uniref:3-hydroxy-3-methylglutaryl coenzyme A reductase n=1 Tax=Galbibacter orientalis DSM 19592 TaxID=926559 RepID=I3C2V0_9FLAO|nr:hydroxymethylglutaryl-CoA reductase, degradative [Galbibacter orientalis]EIJ37943.1 hydroxymethylglutaryl-CoA reductase, degradative [Galbibacter orientalis DSM 19592]
MAEPVNGFSKLTKNQKIEWLAKNHFINKEEGIKTLEQYWNKDAKLQALHDEFIENTISNFYLPLGIAPNFLINQKYHTIPMAIEESSVVAAAGKAAKYWQQRGGFKTKILGTEKIGQVHFMYHGDASKLKSFFTEVEPKLYKATETITENMRKRGGGISTIELRNKTSQLDNYYQLHCTFETLDAMGANFINSCLEAIAKTFSAEAHQNSLFSPEEKNIEIVMSILSNYVPNCVVKAEVSCKIEELNEDKNLNPQEFADKFVRAVAIANAEPHRAVTHNKGIMNGVDAVVLATGNDFRAIEAGAHAYASKSGSYKSLTHAEIKDGIFKFWIEIPLALGTVGGLTSLHPLVKLSLEILDKPSARALMQIIAVAGLAQNFAAVRSLITDGIQKGHMKMHLMNILNQLGATAEEKAYFVDFYKNKTITHSNVIKEFNDLKAKNV